MRIHVITVDLVHQYWEQVEPFLKAALDTDPSPEYNIDQLKVLIIKGHQDLLVAVDDKDTICGAATVEFLNYPKCRVAFVSLIGGRLICNQETWKQFSDWMRDNGASRCRGVVSKVGARLWSRYGFQEMNKVIVEAELYG